MRSLRRSLTAVVLVALAAATTSAAPSRWTIDPAHTEAAFQIRHFFSKVRGVFHDVEGTIVFDENDPSAIQVNATAKVASVDTGNPKRDGHLQSADFFEADRNPTLSFKSTSVRQVAQGQYQITGDLTMRGVTKPVTFDAEFLGSSPISVAGQSWGGKAGFSATAVVNRKDFGINWNKLLDNGGAMLGDEVTLQLNVEADQAK
jgi:polyisoprenoid-binding protein YceI